MLMSIGVVGINTANRLALAYVHFLNSIRNVVPLPSSECFT